MFATGNILMSFINSIDCFKNGIEGHLITKTHVLQQQQYLNGNSSTPRAINTCFFPHFSLMFVECLQLVNG